MPGMSGGHMNDLKAAIAQRFAVLNNKVAAVENGKERGAPLRRNDS